MLPISRYLVFLAFFLSGAAGLIYESMWSHYLGLFLGHAASAQTLTLCLFMGGMAIGAWLTSIKIQFIKNSLLLYAICELALGIFGFAFHGIFTSFLDFSYDYAIPTLSSSGLVPLYKWVSSALLLLPQSIILGATFPLLSSCLIRWEQERSGAILSTLYFTNSIGAVIGVLIATFVLLPTYGTDGALFYAAVINVVVAIGCFSIFKFTLPDPTHLSDITKPYAEAKEQQKTKKIILITATITGAASFIYEIAWIRMLNLVFGTTLHSFELMLSAFILGLALGGLWIKKRIDKIQSPLKYLGRIQIIMGICAISTMPLYIFSFDIVATLLQSAIQKTDLGYSLYNLITCFIAMVIMVPVTFCAGMVLPLATHILIKKDGEKSIGQVYSANTVGAIIGASFATHVGLSFLGLKYLILLGACIDAALGIYLINAHKKEHSLLAYTFITIGLLAVINVNFKPEILSSGAFRYHTSKIDNASKVIFYESGKTASISVIDTPHGNNVLRVISTNGKPDAGIYMGRDSASPDESTMMIAAAIPLLMKPDAKLAANIGFGSGMTSHVVLSNTSLERLDSIEIEKQIIEGGKLFHPLNTRVYKDDRSKLHIDDAKSFFASKNELYDFIISEPSNPWVAGVGNLFSEEFYARIKKYLKQDGLLVQWIQLYEISPKTIASLFLALDKNFNNYHFYLANEADLIIVATDSTRDSVFNISPLDQQPKLRRELNKIKIDTEDQIRGRLVATKQTFSPLLNKINHVTNSDYFPYLSLYAPRDRFTNASSTSLVSPFSSGIPYKELFTAEPVYGLHSVDDLFNPLLDLYKQEASYVDLLDLASTGDKSAYVYLSKFNILSSPENFCGVENSKELEYQWLSALIMKAKTILPNLEKRRREIFSFDPSIKLCRERSQHIETKLIIDLQQAIALHNWEATYQLSWRLLDIHNKETLPNTISNYALNHFLFSSLKTQNVMPAISYIDQNSSSLAPASDSTSRWLQSLLIDSIEK